MRITGPRLGIERVCAALDASENRRRTSRVTTRIVTGARPRAGHARFCATPNGRKLTSFFAGTGAIVVRAGKLAGFQRSGSNSSGRSKPAWWKSG